MTNNVLPNNTYVTLYTQWLQKEKNVLCNDIIFKIDNISLAVVDTRMTENVLKVIKELGA